MNTKHFYYPVVYPQYHLLKRTCNVLTLKWSQEGWQNYGHFNTELAKVGFFCVLHIRLLQNCSMQVGLVFLQQEYSPNTASEPTF